MTWCELCGFDVRSVDVMKEERAFWDVSPPSPRAGMAAGARDRRPQFAIQSNSMDKLDTKNIKELARETSKILFFPRMKVTSKTTVLYTAGLVSGCVLRRSQDPSRAKVEGARRHRERIRARSHDSGQLG